MKIVNHSKKVLACIVIVLAQIQLLGSGKSYPKSLFEDARWKIISEKNGVVVYKKDIPGSDFVAFGGKGVIDAKMEHVIEVLRDSESSKEWVPMLRLKENIKEVSDTEIYSYNHHDLPWPVTDREMVLHQILTADRKHKKIIVTTYSLPLSKVPVSKERRNHYRRFKKDRVRSNLTENVVIFQDRGEDQTYLEFIAHVDPGGSMPAWLVNGMQRRWPPKFLMRLERRANEIGKNPQKGIMKKIESIR